MEPESSPPCDPSVPEIATEPADAARPNGTQDPRVRRDRRVGLSIIGVSFLAALCVSWWASVESALPVSQEPDPPEIEGLAGYPNALRPLEQLERAASLSARGILRGIVMIGLRREGTIDLTHPSAHIRFAFQSPPGKGPHPKVSEGEVLRRSYCGRQNVRIDQRGIYAEPDQPLHPCTQFEEPLPAPRCTIESLWQHAERKGFDRERLVRIEYYRAHAGPAWRFEQPGTPHRFVLYGDCEKELTGVDAAGGVP